MKKIKRGTSYVIRDMKRINYRSEKDDSKKIEKTNLTIAFNVLYAKKRKYILPTFQNITQDVINNFSHDSKQKRMTLYYSKKLSALSRGITSKSWQFLFSFI